MILQVLRAGFLALAALDAVAGAGLRPTRVPQLCGGCRLSIASSVGAEHLLLVVVLHVGGDGDVLRAVVAVAAAGADGVHVGRRCAGGMRSMSASVKGVARVGDAAGRCRCARAW